MRTSLIKIDGAKREAVLLAGGTGFKIHAITGLNALIVSSKKQLKIVHETSPDFKTVLDYVNLKYQPTEKQASVKQDFELFLKGTNP